MGYFPGLDDENEDDMTPVSSIAGPATTRDKVMQRISEVRNPSQTDPAQGGDDSAAAIDFARQSAQTAGMGRALNALASGTGFKADNSAYDNMEKQGTDVAQKAMNREALVKKAIEDRRSKEALAATVGSMKNRAQSETERHNRAMEAHAAAAADAKNGSKRLPPDKVLAVNEGNTIPTMLEDIKSTIGNNKDTFGPFAGRLSSMNPYNERATTIDAQMRAAAQSFGRYMEGGVLRKEDEDKYRKMFPALSDTPEVAQNKLAIVDKLLRDKQGSNIGALRDQGYDVAGVDRGLSPGKLPAALTSGPGEGIDVGVPDAQAAGQVFNAQDVAMLQKAKARLAANPNDEKAKQVLGVLRSKGLQ